MGLIIGKFRKKKSTYDILEKLENEITSIEEFGRSTEQFRKKVIGRFILLAILIYFILACFLYFYYNRISSNQQLVYFIPLIAFPFVIWFIKKFLAWYYSKKLQRNEKKLVKLKDEKKKILNNVMETETYKVAKKILDKFGNEKKQLTVSEVPLSVRNTQPGLRQRQPFSAQPTKARLSFGSPKTPNFPQPTPLALEKTFPQPTPYGFSSRPITATASRMGALIPSTPVASAPLPLPRSILPRNRTVLDKMVDYLVGDGPSNRYALICKKCSSHNGMALKEEFEYLSFRCCYCSHFNAASKKKPTDPKFESPRTLRTTQLDDTSESDRDTVDSDPDIPKLKTIERRLSDTRNSSPEAEKSSDPEKNSDFDKLSDFDYRDSGNATMKSSSTEKISEVMEIPSETKTLVSETEEIEKSEVKDTES